MNSTEQDQLSRAAVRPSPWGRAALWLMDGRRLMGLATLLTLAIYLQSLLFDFVYDDVVLVLLNPWMRGWHNVHTIFTSTFWAFVDDSGSAGGSGFYRPFTMMWLFLANLAGSGAPGFFHLVVLLTHLAVMGLLFLLARRLTGDAVTAGIAALLFGIHPTHVESVAWISGISDVLCAMFFLAALLSYLRWADGEGRCWLLLSLLCLESALLSKEAAALLVVLVVADRWRESREHLWFARIVHACYVSLPYIVLSGLHFAWQFHVVAGRTMMVEPRPMLPSWKVAPIALWWYSKKQILAAPVCTHYTPLAAEWVSWWAVAGATVFALALLALAFWLARASRAGQLLVGVAVLTLLPVVVAAQGLQLHDRYLYLPGMALAIGAASLLRQAPGLRGRLERQAVVVLLLCAVLVPLSARETSYWATDVGIFEHSVARQPGTSMNLNALASAYCMVNDQGRAEAALLQSATVRPPRSMPWASLSLMYMRQGRVDEAEAAARRTLTLPPANNNFVIAFDVLSQVAAKRGQGSEAELWARRAVTANYYRGASHRTLATALALEGRQDESLAEGRLAGALDASARH